MQTSEKVRFFWSAAVSIIARMSGSCLRSIFIRLNFIHEAPRSDMADAQRHTMREQVMVVAKLWLARSIVHLIQLRLQWNVRLSNLN